MDDRGSELTISVREAAKRLGVSERYAWSMAGTGRLPTVKMGRRRLVPVRDLERMVRPTAPGGRGGEA